MRAYSDALFQPTLPARGATKIAQVYPELESISTHAPRTGSDTEFLSAPRDREISTHAPRTGSDMSV